MELKSDDSPARSSMTYDEIRNCKTLLDTACHCRFISSDLTTGPSGRAACTSRWDCNLSAPLCLLSRRERNLLEPLIK